MLLPNLLTLQDFVLPKATFPLGSVYIYTHCLASSSLNERVLLLKPFLRTGLSNTIKFCLIRSLVSEVKAKNQTHKGTKLHQFYNISTYKLSCIGKLKWQWVSHLARRYDSRWGRRVLEWKLRIVGRPSTHSKENRRMLLDPGEAYVRRAEIMVTDYMSQTLGEIHAQQWNTSGWSNDKIEKVLVLFIVICDFYTLIYE